ncbi:MAG: hypothetical protein ACJA2O_003316, partial [Candidatus Azotimanducaceae bacterium]
FLLAIREKPVQNRAANVTRTISLSQVRNG